MRIFPSYLSIQSIVCYIDIRAKSFPYKVFDINSFYYGILQQKAHTHFLKVPAVIVILRDVELES